MSHFTVRRLIATTLVLAVAPAAVAHARSADGFGTVERGDRGDDVRLVQRALTQYGLHTRADGVFGRRTQRNVRRYERREDLAVDGRVSRGQARGLLRRAEMDTALLEDWGAGDRPEPQPTQSGTPATSPTFPVQGLWREGDGFGERGGGHDGVDVLAGCGTPVVAPEGGTVVFSGEHARAGHYLVVRSAQTGEDHAFMHLQSAPVPAKGDEVAAGAPVGAVGRSGNASTCHLHLEIWTAPGWYEGGQPRDPGPDLARWSR